MRQPWQQAFTDNRPCMIKAASPVVLPVSVSLRDEVIAIIYQSYLNVY
jgi:hypothetical protein